jgi:hypothetical protein
VLSTREQEVLALMAEGRFQRRHRPPTVGRREHRRETRVPHPRQTEPPRDRR